VKHVRVVMVAILFAAAAMLGGVYGPILLAQQPNSSSAAVPEARVTSSPQWEIDFNAGLTGIYQEKSNGQFALMAEDSLQQSGDSVVVVGVLSKTIQGGWISTRCDNSIFGVIRPAAEVVTEFEKWMISGKRHVALEVVISTERVYEVNGLGQVVGLGRTGYCKIPPNKNLTQRLVSGPLGSPEGPYPRALYPCFEPMASRTMPYGLVPQSDEVALLDAHHRHEVEIQGRFDPAPKGFASRFLGGISEFDRITFITPRDCKDRHVAFLPNVPRPFVKAWTLFFPLVGRSELKGWNPNTLQWEAFLPLVHMAPAPQEATGAYPGPSSKLPLAGTLSADVVAFAPQQAFNYLEVAGRSVIGTDDGGAVTDTHKARDPISNGDGPHVMNESGSYRMTWPAWISPGRVDARPKVMLITNNSNAQYGWLTLTDEGWQVYIIFGGDRRVLRNGAVLVGFKTGKVYEWWGATDTGYSSAPETASGPFGFGRYEMDMSNPMAVGVRETAWIETNSPVYEVEEDRDPNGRRILHLVEDEGVVRTVDAETLVEVEVPIYFDPIWRWRDQEDRYLTAHRGNWTHSSKWEKKLAIGSGRNGFNLADLETRQSRFIPVEGTKRVYGVAFDFHPSAATYGMLALNALDRLVVLRPSPDFSSYEVVKTIMLNESVLDPMSYLAGPQAPVAWLPNGKLVSSFGQAQKPGEVMQYEFAMWDALSGALLRVFDLDQAPAAWPNDLDQCKEFSGNCEPPPSTDTPPPPPTSTLTPTSTLPPSETPVPTPTPTCVPISQRGDIVLVMDTSSSMGESIPGGGTKFEALKVAARVFLEQIIAPPNQVSLVSFSNTAGLHVALTTDKTRVVREMENRSTGAGTRIDLGIDKAREELMSSRRIPTNTPVIVLISDGIQIRDLPIASAKAAKDAGIVIWTIGLGANADRALLEALASDPGKFRYAPTRNDLIDIYRQIAREIPCPTPVP